MTTVTVIRDDGAETVVNGVVSRDSIMVDVDMLGDAIGWSLEPTGLCRGDVCVPSSLGSSDSGTVDLVEVAQALSAPLATDGARVAAFGAPGALRSELRSSTRAPDFTLGLLTGGDFTFSSLRGRKRLVVAWASW